MSLGWELVDSVEEAVFGRARSLDIGPFRLERFLKGSLVRERGIV